jgi:hypothetical protein
LPLDCHSAMKSGLCRLASPSVACANPGSDWLSHRESGPLADLVGAGCSGACLLLHIQPTSTQLSRALRHSFTPRLQCLLWTLQRRMEAPRVHSCPSAGEIGAFPEERQSSGSIRMAGVVGFQAAGDLRLPRSHSRGFRDGTDHLPACKGYQGPAFQGVVESGVLGPRPQTPGIPHARSCH